MSEPDTSQTPNDAEVEKLDRSEPSQSDAEGDESRSADGKPLDDEPSRDSSDGQETFQPEPVSWSRVGLGFVVIAALHCLLAVLIASTGIAGQTMLTIALGLIPYSAGGLMLGLLTRSAERSLLDPFYAAVGPALVFPFAIEVIRISTTNPADVAQAMTRVQWIAVLVPVMIYVLLALFGCWLGEQLSLRRRTSADLSTH